VRLRDERRLSIGFREVLPPDVGTDLDRRARFEGEAKTIAPPSR
jgi:hypothetical protein